MNKQTTRAERIERALRELVSAIGTAHLAASGERISRAWREADDALDDYFPAPEPVSSPVVAHGSFCNDGLPVPEGTYNCSGCAEPATRAVVAVAPEMATIPAGEAREGDTVTIVGTLRDEIGHRDGSAYVEIGGLAASSTLLPGLSLTDPIVTVTRPVSPLPTPGRVAYEAARTERLTRRPTEEVIGWDELKGGTRRMWEAAADAVLASAAAPGAGVPAPGGDREGCSPPG